MAETLATTPNQGITTLNGALSNVATSMPVGSIANLGLTGLSSPDFAYCKLTKIANWRKHPINNPESFEIIKVTAISGNTATIVRAQDGTTGIAFADKDIVECVFVSAHYQHLVDTLTDGTKDISVGAITVANDLTVTAGDLEVAGGNVGIGVTPNAAIALHVERAIGGDFVEARIRNTSTNAGSHARLLFVVAAGSSGAECSLVFGDSAALRASIASTAADDLIFRTSNAQTDRMIINSAGDMQLVSGDFIVTLGETFLNLPTSAGTSGSLWNDSGTVKVVA